MTRQNQVAPDGGWGWVVLLAAIMINFFLRSVFGSFGLLFGDLLKEIDGEMVVAAVINNTQDLCFYSSGIVIAPLIRQFSYRKVSIVGAILCSVGLALTCRARTLWHILITYGIIFGVGLSLVTTAGTFIALNRYFKKRRGLATGFSMIGISLGMLLMPHVVRLLLEQYGFRGTILIYAGFCAHGVLAACLLQPVEWHTIKKNTSHIRKGYHVSASLQVPVLDLNETEGSEESLIDSKKNLDVLEQGGYGPGNTMIRQQSSASLPIGNKIPFMSRYLAALSCENIDGLQHHFQKRTQTIIGRSTSHPHLLHSRQSTSIISHGLNKNITNGTSIELLPNGDIRKKSIWQKTVKYFYLDILTDPIYLTLVFGIALYIVGETSFTMMLPFTLQSLGFNNKDMSFYMSMQAVGDLASRIFISPICDRISVRKQLSFILEITLLAVIRVVFINQSDATTLSICLIISGFLRGACYITFVLVLAEYSSAEKNAAAYGLHLVIRGIVVMTVGPLIGYIRDRTRSYSLGVYAQSLVLMVAAILWGIQYGMIRWKSKMKIEKALMNI